MTTGDGYVLRLERIPRPGSRNAVFFLHGVMDTAMGWVATSAGVTGEQTVAPRIGRADGFRVPTELRRSMPLLGSHAFAAYDMGFDVWLGNSRSNPPHANIDPDRQGSRYWQYSVNELGLEDCGALIDAIHEIKTAELGPSSSDHPPPVPVFQRPLAAIPSTSTVAAAVASAGASPSLGPVAQAVERRLLVGGGPDHPGSPLRKRQPPFAQLVESDTECESSAAWASDPDSPPMLEPNQQQERQRRRRRGHRDTASSDTSFTFARHIAPPPLDLNSPEWQPQPQQDTYNLRAVGHSLGGAMLLIHLVSRRRAGRPHHLSRVILLTPAGFHSVSGANPLPCGVPPCC